MSDIDTTWKAGALRVRIAERGIRKGWLAEKLEVSPNTITNWCSGRTEPSASSLYELALLLDCTIAELLGKEPR